MSAEALLRGFLQNASARHQAVAGVAPEAPSADHLTGFGAGWGAGQVAGLALALSVLTGESPAALIEEAGAAAAIEAAFPFDLVMESVG